MGMKKVFALVLLIVALTALGCAATAEKYVCVVHKGEWVWVRDQPSKNGKQIGKIRYGYEVDVSEIKDGYAHISFKDLSGYVDVSYLEKPIHETTYTVISHGPLAKRKTPEGRLMCWVKSGARISVFGWRYSKSGDLWARVYKGGYCRADYLELR